MRGLSQQFIDDLKCNFLSDIIFRVRMDKDLDLQIREGYINIYFKGNSLLKLTEVEPHNYRVDIHEKFSGGLDSPRYIVSYDSTTQFLNLLPFIKENIIKFGASTIEAEYEQLVIRANNSEERSNSEYYILDRQYTTESRDRFDLTGFYWDRVKRARGQEVPLCFIELKFSLNPDIKNVHEQINRYYQHVRENVNLLAQEAEKLLDQKLKLGLLKQPNNRLDAIKTLTISKNINEYEFILLLIDYNPYSKLLNLDALKSLPFSKQIKIFYSGLGLWKSQGKEL